MKTTWKTWMRSLLLIGVCAGLLLSVCACGSQPSKKVVIGEGDWDSCKFHDQVVAFILTEGYEYECEIMPASTPMMVTGLTGDDIDVVTELWSDNIMDEYNAAIENGDFHEVATNFADNQQGLYVPTYMIEGDAERGIDPMTPDLVTVEDLKQYADLFPDPEDPGKGRIYGAIAGWAADDFLAKKMEAYELDEYYNYMRPGSDAALSSSLASAFEKGDPWVGYYWEPTWIVGKYDVTLLEDTPYSEEDFEQGIGAFPSVNVTVCVSNDLNDSDPDVAEFLSHYTTSSALTSEALAYMMENEADHMETAKWFLSTHMDMWQDWVPDDVFEKVEKALQ